MPDCGGDRRPATSSTSARLRAAAVRLVRVRPRARTGTSSRSTPIAARLPSRTRVPARRRTATPGWPATLQGSAPTSTRSAWWPLAPPALLLQPYPGGNVQPDAWTRPSWELLYAQPVNADLILNGHAHMYERFRPLTPLGDDDPANGIRELTIGTGGVNVPSFASMTVARGHLRRSCRDAPGPDVWLGTVRPVRPPEPVGPRLTRLVQLPVHAGPDDVRPRHVVDDGVPGRLLRQLPLGGAERRSSERPDPPAGEGVERKSAAGRRATPSRRAA